jgi:hypothetical protein
MELLSTVGILMGMQQRVMIAQMQLEVCLPQPRPPEKGWSCHSYLLRRLGLFMLHTSIGEILE